MIGPSEISMAGKAPVSLRVLFAAWKRGWRVLLIGFLAGLVLAAALVVGLKPTYISQSALLLRRIPSQDVNPLSAQQTEAAVARSEVVSRRVVEKLGLPITPLKLTQRYATQAVTDNVLQFTVRWKDKNEARVIADTLANEYLTYRAEQQQAQTDLITSSVGARAEAVRVQLIEAETQIKDLNSQLGADVDPAQSRQLESLNLQRDSLGNELIILEQRIDEAQLASQVALKSSTVVQEATVPRRPLFPWLPTDLAVGIFLGLVGATSFLLAREVLSAKIRLRQEIATAVGASVIAELPWTLERSRLQGGPTTAWSASDRSRAFAELLWALRSGLGRDGVERLVVASVDSDDTTARLVAMWAAELASRGTVVVDTFGDGAERINKALRSVQRSAGVSGHIDVRTLTSTMLPVTPAVRVHLVVLFGDSRRDWAPLSGHVGSGIVCVAAGATSADALHGTSIDLRALGVDVVGCVLAGPDASDRTSGHPAPLAMASVPTVSDLTSLG
jgi:capsular polysaccharide biosynthesis protein